MIKLIGAWLILFGVLSLFASKVPTWIVPACAIVVGGIVLFYGSWKKA